MPEFKTYLDAIRKQISTETPPTDYAPMSHPQRMETIGRLTTDALRQSIETVCKELIKTTDALYNATLAIQSEAHQFVGDLRELGEKKAVEIENHTKKLQAFLTTMAIERERFFETKVETKGEKTDVEKQGNDESNSNKSPDSNDH